MPLEVLEREANKITRMVVSVTDDKQPDETPKDGEVRSTPEIVADRDEKGRILPGRRPAGRAAGTPNKISVLRSEFVRVYEENDGPERLKELLEHDSVSFFRLMVAMVPKLKIQESRALNVDVDLSEVPTARIAQSLGVDPEQFAKLIETPYIGVIEDAASGSEIEE